MEKALVAGKQQYTRNLLVIIRMNDISTKTNNKENCLMHYKGELEKPMIKNKATGIFVLLILTLGVSGCDWLFGTQPRSSPKIIPQKLLGTNRPVSTPTPSPVNSYTNQKWGFTISFPKSLHTEMPFSTSYLLSNKWRYGADENTKGIPVISIPVFRIPQQTTYPRFYNVEVRIGVSTDLQDLKTLTAAPGNGEGLAKNETINGVVFKVYPFQDAAMMKYVSGYSYRAVHKNVCYVIEQIKSGSSYHDVKDPKDIPDATLDAYFQQAGDIVKTFKFIQ